MPSDPTWNDESRAALRQSLHTAVRGNLRLAKWDHETILEDCREIHIQAACPDEEREGFVQFVIDELDRETERLVADQVDWPAETDCDRLDRVEQALLDRNIILWQASPCCDSCTMSELSDRVALLEEERPGLGDRCRGYAFFIDQDLPEELADATQLTVYLSYGWIIREDKVPPAVYRKHAIGIAQEVCQCLKDEAFKPAWNGDLNEKITLALNWQRRTRLA
jgi:hypothetical protein